MSNEKEKVQKIHEATLRILQNTGMKFVHPDAQKILREHGVRMEGDVAFFTPEQVMEWVGKAPSSFLFEGINPKYNITIGDGHWSRGVTIVTNLIDRDGTMRDATIEDYIKIQKLYEANPNIGFNGGMTVDPVGIPPEWNDLVLNYISLCHCEKPLYTAGGNYEEMEAVIEMTRTRFGYTEDELRKHCVLVGLSNPNTPLLGTDDMTETILTFGKYRQPVVICSAAMAGTTSPVTIAGTIAVTNAEVLGGIILAQMANPGTPVIYGTASTAADLRSCAIAIGAPESALCVKYGAELAHFYNLPCRGGGTLSDANIFSPQCAYEGELTYLASRQHGINLMLHSAGVMNGYLSMSYDKMILDFEIQDHVDRYLRDIEVNEETIPEDVIHEVGHGGEYLTSVHTYDYMKEELLAPHLANRGSQNDPQTFYKNVDKRIEQLLGMYQKPEVPEDKLAQMQELLRKRGISEDVIACCTV